MIGNDWEWMDGWIFRFRHERMGMDGWEWMGLDGWMDGTNNKTIIVDTINRLM